MKKSIISVKPHSVFAMCDYSKHSQPCNAYKIWDVVFKPSEVKECTNPIGVVLQIHERQELRADMYGNTCYSQIRPATYAEIKAYCPDLLPKLQLPEYLQALKNEIVKLKERAATSEGKAKLAIQKRIRFCENEADNIIYAIQETI